ncbi:MAG: transcription factor [Geobacteraceae bacterium GWC2_58_44]|nr:MAG: transcription factor [Geobacteraceae bacterium GWC2_58_44]
MYRHLITALAISAVLALSATAQGAPARKAPQKPLAPVAGAPALTAQAPPAAKPAEPRLPPLSVVSIIPAQGEPGMTVTMNGSGFTGATRAFLGNRELPTTVVGARVLNLELPDLPPGVYALYLRREDGSTSRPYNFVLQPQKPVASALSPDTVSTCAAGREREVLLSGANFREGARIIFDGAAISTRFISPSALSFMAPQIASGLHQVQVKNPSDAVSGILALFLDSKPEIENVAIGSEYVSHYDLIVTGRNFQQTSMLVADGVRIGTEQRVAGEREQLIYLGCNQLIYVRHPYDPTPKNIKLQVVNQNGEESGVFSISAP